MRMNPVNGEGEDPVMIVRIGTSENTDPRDLRHALISDPCELVFLFLDRIKTDRVHVTDRLGKCISAAGIDGSRLKFMRNFCPDSTLSCDGFDHLAAGEKWRELL